MCTGPFARAAVGGLTRHVGQIDAVTLGVALGIDLAGLERRTGDGG